MTHHTDYDALAPDWKDYVKFPGREESYRFYVNLFTSLKAGKVLDIGGGVGQHAIELTKAGIAVEVCDISEKMIEEGRKNAAAAGVSIDFKVADWTRLNEVYKPATFDGAMETLSSVALNHTQESLARNLASASYALKSGGIFALDIRNFAAYNMANIETGFNVIDNDSFLVKAEVVMAFLTTHKRTGDQIIQYVKPWTPAMLMRALREQGFKDIHMYADFDSSKERYPNESLGETVRHIQLVARKPATA